MKKSFLTIPGEKFTVLNYLFIFLFAGIVLTSGFFEIFIPGDTIYSVARGPLWLIGGLFYVLGFGYPLARLGTTHDALKKQIFAFLFLIISTLTLGFIYIVNEHDPKPNHYTVLGIVVSTLTIILGWLIHASLGARHQRRQHTLNVLLQTRMSTEYQSQARNLRCVYSQHSTIPEDVVGAYYENKLATNKETDKKKKLNIEAAVYFLNFYEFLAIGIRHGDLDEDVLYDTLKAIAPSLYTKTLNIIKWNQKNTDHEVLTEFENLVERWQGRAKASKKLER